MLVFAAACLRGESRLLSYGDIRAPALSPAVRDGHNRFDIGYTLADPSRVSAHVENQSGMRWTIHESVLRPLKGTYRLALDGTVSGPGPTERQVLPDGDYRVVIDAVSVDRQEQIVVPITIRDADTSAPEVTDLTVFPDRITPNFDALDDVVQVTYRLAKPVRSTPFADRILPDGTRARAWTGEERKLEPGEQRLLWDGSVSGRPVPDGEYELSIRASDAAGNVREARTRLYVEAGGRPEAKVVWGRIAPGQIIRGQAVCVEAVVRNTGQTVIRSQGPPPGYVYDSFQSYSSIQDEQVAEHAGFWRLGLDWAGSSTTSGAKYPYRWGLGSDLAPGEEVTVNGCVRVQNEQSKMVFFAALVQENVAIHDAGTALVQVSVSP